ncbi:MAG TPA: hypothetical protein VFN15_03850 [Solirubrobacterales bacterium]|nr:hypothetical protein [Solirubrobacterales bacterium]
MPAFVALALLLGACGDEDGGDAVTTDPESLVPSKRDYIVQADTICDQVDQAIRTEAEISLGISADDFELTPEGEIVFLPGRRPSDQRVRRFGTEVVLPALRDQLERLRALTPPSGDEAAVAAIYDRAERGIDRLEADPGAFNDAGAVRRSLTEARRLGRRYGFFECGTYSGP